MPQKAHPLRCPLSSRLAVEYTACARRIFESPDEAFLGRRKLEEIRMPLYTVITWAGTLPVGLSENRFFTAEAPFGDVSKASLTRWS